MTLKRRAVAPVLALAGLLGLSDAAYAAFGAIAYSPSSGASGYSYSASTRAQAESLAYRYCSRNANDCQIAIWFRSACGAVARGANGGWGSGWAAGKNGAYNQALASCRQNTRQCRVVAWACSG